ncbi:hypothetical protein ACN28I_31895 [Archangium gephyra]|uniref:hypothetical protein n=1 Tax=Archangium gephyra TaxID=48 RepID=UPI003B775EA4
MARIDGQLRVGEPPQLLQAGPHGEHRAAGQTHGPAIAVGIALVPEPVDEPRLGEQRVELLSVRLRHGLAHLLQQPGGRGVLRPRASRHRAPDAVHQRFGNLQGILVGEVVAQAAVADPLQVRPHLLAHRAGHGRQPLEDLLRGGVGEQQLASRRIRAQGLDEGGSLLGGELRGQGRVALEEARELTGALARPALRVDEEIPHGEDVRDVVEVVQAGHGDQVIAARHQVLLQLRGGQRGGLHGLQGEVRADGGRFLHLIPVPQVLAPALAFQGLLRDVQPAADSRMQARHQLHQEWGRRRARGARGGPEGDDLGIHEPVDAHRAHGFDHQAIPGRSLGEARLEPLEERLNGIPGPRAMGMRCLQLPASRAGGLELHV